jgi:Na+/proline symporter
MFGLAILDLIVMAAYFLGIIAFGLWISRRVKTEEDYFLGGRRFGKGVLVFHWLCTGTHTDNPVQVCGATFRVGLGGIWYQWMWLFCTPFYWLIAPLTRRLRYLTTGDFFRARYSPGLERLYALLGMVFYIMIIAQVVLGAGKAISGATAGAIQLGPAVILLSFISAIYVMTGGLVAAAYTDIAQGILIILLSVLLIPFGLHAAGGAAAVGKALPAAMLSIVAPAGAKEGTLFFVAMMSLVSLVGIVVQPHTLTATGSGKTEMEARLGMCYGNFIKRLLTIAWAFAGIIGFVLFAPELSGAHSDEVWGRLIRQLLPTGFRGLMLAAMLAGVTACETYMVVGSSLFTRNFYSHVAPGRPDQHYLRVGRIASLLMLLGGVLVAFAIPSLTKVLKLSMEIIALMGAAFWVGIAWRRANAWGAWAGTLGAAAVWAWAYAMGWDTPERVALFVPVEFGLLILVSLLTPRQADAVLDPFFARMHTAVADEKGTTLTLDPQRPKLIRHRDFEIPQLTAMDIGGFALAWALVAGLILLLKGLAMALQ